jgi:hypothetical protein
MSSDQSKAPAWHAVITAEWRAQRAAEGPNTALFPLAMNPFGEEELIAMTEVLLSGRLTMGANVEAAEFAFAKAVGAPYAVMVNSGSSANLLAVAAIANKLRPVHCDAGDEVLVPSVCWSTSVHPLLQVRHVGCCPLHVLCSVHFVFLAVDISVS